ncbi:hypothetical protein E2C01_057140 [Portunus trituberculatus]|uniref:Uncharacterized protein n=1 Tax=Portunus trituberculatus TaxID=210409 RepID=A0A5B7H112_PORTR|nr:hypothetical protein [Portunus trituberculatus]
MRLLRNRGHNQALAGCFTPSDTPGGREKEQAALDRGIITPWRSSDSVRKRFTDDRKHYEENIVAYSPAL